MLIEQKVELAAARLKHGYLPPDKRNIRIFLAITAGCIFSFTCGFVVGYTVEFFNHLHIAVVR